MTKAFACDWRSGMSSPQPRADGTDLLCRDCAAALERRFDLAHRPFEEHRQLWLPGTCCFCSEPTNVCEQRELGSPLPPNITTDEWRDVLASVKAERRMK